MKPLYLQFEGICMKMKVKIIEFNISTENNVNNQGKCIKSADSKYLHGYNG